MKIGLPQIEFVYPIAAKPGATVWVYGRSFAPGDAVWFSDRHIVADLVRPGLIEFRVSDDAHDDYVGILRGGLVLATSDDLVKVLR